MANYRVLLYGEYTHPPVTARQMTNFSIVSVLCELTRVRMLTFLIDFNMNRSEQP